MKQLLTALLASFIFTGFAGASTPAIKVGTYNIRIQHGDRGTPNAWNARRTDLVDFIKKMDLDVFGLQEVCPGQADYLAKKLPAYSKVGVHRTDGKRRGEACPVFFRKDRFDSIRNGTFWLSKTPEVPGSISWGASCTRICSWTLLKDRKSGKTFCFANAHTDHKSALARKNGMLLIIEKMREFAPAGTPVIFTGDHNCTEDSEPSKAMASVLRDSIYASETPPAGPSRTYNGWTLKDNEFTIAEALRMPKGKRDNRNVNGIRIDYIYVSDSIKVKSYTAHGDARPNTKLYHSDHFLVTAVIEL